MSTTMERAPERLRNEGPESCEPYVKRFLLWSGIAAVILYVIGDLVSGLLYDGYSFRDQAVSELAAFGSPVRPLMVSVILRAQAKKDEPGTLSLEHFDPYEGDGHGTRQPIRSR